MKTGKIDRVVSGLRMERDYIVKHRDMLQLHSEGHDDACDVLNNRRAVVDELLALLGEMDAPKPDAAPKRTRKRKAGLPEVG